MMLGIGSLLIRCLARAASSLLPLAASMTSVFIIAGVLHAGQ